MENVKNRVNFKIIFIILCCCMTIPSCLYIAKGNNIMDLTSSFSFFINPSNQILSTQKIVETILFMGLWIGISIVYCYLIKHHQTIFPTWKSMVMVIVIVSILFMAILPITSTDIFYYIGTRME